MGRKITENLGFESPLRTLKKIAVFYGEFENEQKKEREFEHQIFSKFPAHDLNFHGR